jgi:hypothetical protein
VLHSAAVGVPVDYMSVGRDYDAAEWSTNARILAMRRLLTAEGALTGEGAAFKAELEERTDRVALGAYDILDDDEVERLLEALTPLARAVIATGDVPPMTPIGPIAAALD